MKIRPLLLALLMIPSLATAKYDRAGNTIRVYGVKDYTGAFLEGFMGSMVLFYSSVFYAATRPAQGFGVSGTGSLVSGLGVLGGGAAIADAIRRAFASADVMLEISPHGLLCKDAGLVPWDDITRIDAVSFTTVQYGRPFTNGFQLNFSTKESVPVEIDGGHLSESMNTILTFIRKFYKGEIQMKKEVVQDMTPRPTNVNVNNGGNNSDDSLIKLVQLGADLFNR